MKILLTVASTLTVLNAGRIGTWGQKQFCPTGFATAFSLKVISLVSPSASVSLFLGRIDNPVLSGVRLHCSDGTIVTSSAGVRGRWSVVSSCQGQNHLNAFSLGLATRRSQVVRVAERVASNVQFRCSDGLLLRGYGVAASSYSRWSNKCQRGVCGLQTRLDSRVRLEIRESAVTDMRLFCC
uniref:Uncharacterized protein n=1 Tax=Salvator merianae TaxID=96440 RepID=A0A8D0C4U2_SALMN